MKLNLSKLSLNFSQIAWILPFIAFCTGYICLQFFIADNIVQTPDLVGKDILQATQICSALQLNLRIIAEKEVADAKPGTIIKQNPAPHKSIKSHQSIFITTTQLPAPILAPSLLNQHQDHVDKICKKYGIKQRIYFLPSQYPAGQCFAQMPAPQQPIESKKISCYISTGNAHQYLFPDFTNMPLADVLQFLEQHRISFDVYYNDQKLSTPYGQKTIMYQKPLAGTLITLNDKLYVQLKVI